MPLSCVVLSYLATCSTRALRCRALHCAARPELCVQTTQTSNVGCAEAHAKSLRHARARRRRLRRRHVVIPHPVDGTYGNVLKLERLVLQSLATFLQFFLALHAAPTAHARQPPLRAPPPQQQQQRGSSKACGQTLRCSCVLSPRDRSQGASTRMQVRAEKQTCFPRRCAAHSRCRASSSKLSSFSIVGQRSQAWHALGAACCSLLMRVAAAGQPAAGSCWRVPAAPDPSSSCRGTQQIRPAGSAAGAGGAESCCWRQVAAAHHGHRLRRRRHAAQLATAANMRRGGSRAASGGRRRAGEEQAGGRRRAAAGATCWRTCKHERVRTADSKPGSGLQTCMHACMRGMWSATLSRPRSLAVSCAAHCCHGQGARPLAAAGGAPAGPAAARRVPAGAADCRRAGQRAAQQVRQRTATLHARRERQPCMARLPAVRPACLPLGARAPAAARCCPPHARTCSLAAGACLATWWPRASTLLRSTA